MSPEIDHGGARVVISEHVADHQWVLLGRLTNDGRPTLAATPAKGALVAAMRLLGFRFGAFLGWYGVGRIAWEALPEVAR